MEKFCLLLLRPNYSKIQIKKKPPCLSLGLSDLLLKVVPKSSCIFSAISRTQFACHCNTEVKEGMETTTRGEMCSYLQPSSHFAPVAFLLETFYGFFIALGCQKLQLNSIVFVCVDHSNEHNLITAPLLRD